MQSKPNQTKLSTNNKELDVEKEMYGTVIRHGRMHKTVTVTSISSHFEGPCHKI